MKRLVTLGFFLQPWQTVSYTENPAIGRFEGTGVRADGMEAARADRGVPPRARRTTTSGRRAA